VEESQRLGCTVTYEEFIAGERRCKECALLNICKQAGWLAMKQK